MNTEELKEKIRRLGEIKEMLDAIKFEETAIREEIRDRMIANKEDKYIIPEEYSVFLQKKETYKNYPEDIQEMERDLKIKMKEAQLMGKADVSTTYFIKIVSVKDNENGDQ